MKKLILLLLAVLCLTGFTVSSQQISPFRDGDRAVFLGNSITHGGRYHSYIWLYYMTRFPEMDLRIINAGIGGDTAGNMFNRLDSDVFSKNPTVLTVTFGMNDSGYMEYNGDDPVGFGNSRYEECYDNFKKIEARLQGLTDSRIVLMGSSPYDETAVIEDNTPLKGKNEVMRRIVQFQQASAKENNWEFIDLNEPMTTLNQRMQQSDPSFALCGKDRIHPDNDGHMVMAYLYLKAQGMAGKEVATVEIDGSRATVINTVNCGVSDVKNTGGQLSFNYMANSLPYPMEIYPRGGCTTHPQAEAAQLVPIMEEMNRETLKVSGLSGKYKLTIDGIEIGTWNGKELAEGINLAEQVTTPQYQQALSVMHLNELRFEIEHSFRDYAWIQYNFFMPRGLLDKQDAGTLVLARNSDDGWVRGHSDIYSRMMHEDVRKAREEEMELLISRIYEINKPVERRVVLKKL